MKISERTIWAMPKTSSVVLSSSYEARFNPHEYDAIISFVEQLAYKIASARIYDTYIAFRLSKLEKVKYEVGESEHNAASRNSAGYIVFFKQIDDDIAFQRLMHHELFHFIQPEHAAIEEIPETFRHAKQHSGELNADLFEEALVQYLAASVNGFPDEKTRIGDDGELHTYWLNEAYRDIVGYMRSLDDTVGLSAMLGALVDDDAYRMCIRAYDKSCGEGAFEALFEKVCRKEDDS